MGNAWLGKPKMIPYTIVGFILVKCMGLNNITAGLMAGCAAFLVVMAKRDREKKEA